MIQVKNVTKKYGNFTAVNNISIDIAKGSIHGLIGENGSGKTTLIKCMTGIYRPDCGEILIDGENVYENNKIKEKIGYVADNNQYFPSYRLGQVVDFYQDIYPSFKKDRVKELNSVFKLNMNKRVRELSKGQKMRFAFILNIAVEPEVLILDEPTSGLDAMARKQLFDILVDEVDKRNMTVLISSHNLNEIEKICDYVTIVRGGVVAEQNDIDKVISSVARLNIVFNNGAPQEFLSREDIVELSNVGSIYNAVISDFTEDKIHEIEELGASLVEEVPVNLEDVFVYSNEGGRSVE